MPTPPESRESPASAERVIDSTATRIKGSSIKTRLGEFLSWEGKIATIRNTVLIAVWSIVGYIGGVTSAQIFEPAGVVNSTGSKAAHVLGVQQTALDQYNTSQENIRVSRSENETLRLVVKQKETELWPIRTQIAELEDRVSQQDDLMRKLAGELRSQTLVIAKQNTKIAGQNVIISNQKWQIRLLNTQLAQNPSNPSWPFSGTMGNAALKKHYQQDGRYRLIGEFRDTSENKRTYGSLWPMISNASTTPNPHPVTEKISPEDITELLAEVQGELKIPGMELCTKIYASWKQKIWISYKGHVSAGFFTTTPKHRDLLTPQGLTAWVQDRMHYLAQFDTIEKVVNKQSVRLDRPSASEKVAHLKVSEARGEKIRFLLKKPDGSVRDFTLPFNDVREKTLITLLKDTKTAPKEKS